MLLRYTDEDGAPQEFVLTERPITIGRSAEADIVIQDEKASRRHCGILFEGGTYQLRDLKSKNGTFLNQNPIDSEPIQVGDKFRVGSMVFTIEAHATPGPSTAVHEVEEQMADGKGYNTILREIVRTVDEDKPKRSS